MDRRNIYDHTTSKSSFIKSKVEVIDLCGDVPFKSRQPRLVDLTKAEPEIIVLDDTISEFDRSLNQPEVFVSDVDDNWFDVINYKEQPKKNFLNQSSSKDKGKINILNFNTSPCTQDREKTFSESGNIRTCLSGSAKISKKRSKMKNTSCESNKVIKLNRSGYKPTKRKSTKKITRSKKDSILLLQLKRKVTPQKRKRKMIDIASNINISNNIPTIIADQSAKPLSDYVNSYYTNVDKVVKKLNNNSRKSVIQRSCNDKTKNNEYRANNTSIVINKVKKTKPTNKKSKRKKHQKLKEKVKCEFVDTKNSGARKVFKPSTNLVVPFRENNIYNPNPYEVDNEGFRPIVIDGSNIAVGHGRGKFSVKGVKICVDYFATRGHKHVKVFLPQFRQEIFPEEMLKELQTKCDMVFTPSSDINGVRKTPYDDRFIVQYAVEFGGIIVSTDNYRDLLKENPRWQETIKSRLLMFTWVDDFLMFPMDPLGRTGPSLEQFLRF